MSAMNDRVYKSVPFLVCVKDLSDNQINDMVDTLHNDFGGEYFRGKDIFMEVLEDYKKEAAIPRNFQYGPFVGLRIDNKGGLSVDLQKEMHGGYAGYLYEQFLEISKNPEAFLEEAFYRKVKKHQNPDFGMG